MTNVVIKKHGASFARKALVPSDSPVSIPNERLAQAMVNMGLAEFADATPEVDVPTAPDTATDPNADERETRTAPPVED